MDIQQIYSFEDFQRISHLYADFIDKPHALLNYREIFGVDFLSSDNHSNAEAISRNLVESENVLDNSASQPSQIFPHRQHYAHNRNRNFKAEKRVDKIDDLSSQRMDMAILIAYFNPIGYIRP
jgi:hypothetical protein